MCDLRVSTCVYLSPAVGRHVAQDIWHLLEHGQTFDVDLQEDLYNTGDQNINCAFRKTRFTDVKIQMKTNEFN